MLPHSSLTARHHRVFGAGTLTRSRSVCASGRRTRAMITRALIITATAGVAGACSSNPAPQSANAALPAGAPRVIAESDSLAGEYLTTLGGCNDCHTPGWAEQNGKVPDADRLVGADIGYRGPWGTTYPANLRLVVQSATEDKWVSMLTTADNGRGKPPMPWMNTERMNDHDLRAMYRYIKSLGAKGDRMPRALPPGAVPATPYILMAPQQPGR